MDEIISPGGMRLRFIADDPERLVMEATYPGEGGLPPSHVHPTQEERFVVLEGSMHTVIGGVERHYAAGETFDVPAGTPHQMAAEGPARTRWEVRPALRTAEFFRRLYAALAAGADGEPLPELLAEFAPEFELVT